MMTLRHRRRHRVVAAVAACALTLAAFQVALARIPTPGGSKGSLTADSTVRYKYHLTTYPTWLTDAVDDSFVNYYHDANHNSHAPDLAHFQNSATADLHFVGASASPCSGRTDWIQCTSGLATPSWDIYVRDFDGAPLGGTAWWEDTPHCTGGTGSSCFYIHRALIHESGHAMLSFDDLTGWSESDTVMNGRDPDVGTTGATHWDYQRCDEAASQLLWDLKTSAGEYGDCFNGITDHGVNGLVTNLTLSTGTNLFACNGQAIVASGRIEVKDFASYGPLGGNPLTNRTVWFDRGATTKWTSTTASNANGDNWSMSFGGSNVTYTFVAHFDYTSGSGLDASQTRTFTFHWSSSC